jgi:hypothetical protein
MCNAVRTVITPSRHHTFLTLDKRSRSRSRWSKYSDAAEFRAGDQEERHVSRLSADPTLLVGLLAKWNSLYAAHERPLAAVQFCPPVRSAINRGDWMWPPPRFDSW